MYTFFDIEVRHLGILFLSSNKFFTNNRFSFITGWIHFYVIFIYVILSYFYVIFLLSFYTFLCHNFTDLLWNLLPLSTHTLFGLQIDSFKTFWKALVIVVPLLSFQRVTHAYLPKISMRYNKNLNLLSNLLINCILLRSASKILSTKVEYTFLFLKILIIGLYSSSADFLFEIFLF